MSSTKSNPVPTPESVHDAWLCQRAELERNLFDGWTTEVNVSSTAVTSQAVSEPVIAVARQVPAATEVDRFPTVDRNEIEQAWHAEWLKQSNAAAVQHRTEHQQCVTEALSQQREAFFQDLARQRTYFEQELAAREAAWVTQRDQESNALRSAKEIQEAAQQKLKDELSAQRVREREELLQWRRQAEKELAEARRLFEQDRLKQQQEFARQREAEMSQLRRERDEFDTRVRQVQTELAHAKQRQEDELQRLHDAHSAQLRAERAELDKLRDTWLEKFHREQVVLENGLQFFGQHLSRVSQELRVAQCGLKAVSESAIENHPARMHVEPSLVASQPRPLEPAILSLDEIRQRLNEIKKPQRSAA